MNRLKEIWLEIAEGISKSLEENPILILKILNTFLICFLIRIAYQLIRFVIKKIRPDVWYRTHKDAMDVIKNHLKKE